jgi:TP901 family phage tail tape measure protein
MASARIGLEAILEMGNFNRGLSQYKSGIGDAETATGGLSSKLMDMGAKMTDVGGWMTTRISLPLIGIGAAAVKAASDFDDQMAIMEVAARNTGTGLDDLRGAALAVGADTDLVGVSASEAAQAMTNFYKAGLDTTDMFGNLDGYLTGTTDLTGAMRAAVDLAAASNLDLARASDVVAIAMATFGLNAEDATSIADSFVKAADASVAEVEDLAAAMVNVGPTAAQFGWEMGDVNTALAILSERGITGAEAGTALKSMMTNLMRPTKQVTKTLGDLGIELYDASGQMKDLPTIIGDLNKSMAGLTEEERNLAIQTLAGTYGMKAMGTLLEEGEEGWQNMEGAIAGAASAQDVALARTDTLSGSMEALKGALETLLINVGKPLIDDFLRPAVEWITEVASSLLDRLGPGVMGAGLALGGLLVAAGPVLTILGSLATVIGAIGAPILLVIGAVGLLAAAWATNFGGIRDITMEVVGTVVGWVQEQWPRVQEIFTTVMDSIMTAVNYVWPAIEQVIMAVAGAVVSWIQANWPTIQAIFQTVFGIIQSITNTIWPIIQDTILSVAGMIVSWIQANWPLIQETIETVMNAASSVVSTVLAAIQGFWEQYGGQILGFVEIVWTAIKTAIETAMGVILGIIRAIMQAINGDWEGAWETIKGVLETAWTGIKTIIETVGGAILGIIGALVGNIADKFTSIDWGSIGSAIINGIKDGISAGIGALVNIVQQAAQSALDAATDFLGIGSPSKVFMGIGENIMSGMAGGIKTGMKEVPKVMLPNLASSLNAGLAGLTLPAMGGLAAAGVPVGATTVSVTMNPTINNGMDLAEFQALTLHTVQRAVRGY